MKTNNLKGIRNGSIIKVYLNNQAMNGSKRVLKNYGKTCYAISERVSFFRNKKTGIKSQKVVVSILDYIPEFNSIDYFLCKQFLKFNTLKTN